METKKQLPEWIETLNKIVEEAKKEIEKDKKEALIDWYKKNIKS